MTFYADGAYGVLECPQWTDIKWYKADGEYYPYKLTAGNNSFKFSDDHTLIWNNGEGLFTLHRLYSPTPLPTENPSITSTPTPQPNNSSTPNSTDPTPTPMPVPTTIHMYGRAFYNDLTTPCPNAPMTFVVEGIYDDANGNQISIIRSVVGSTVTGADGYYSYEMSTIVLQDDIAALDAQASTLGAGYWDVQFGILPCKASGVNSYPGSGSQYWFMSIPVPGGSYNTNVMVDATAPVSTPSPTSVPSPTPSVTPIPTEEPTLTPTPTVIPTTT